MAAAMGVAVTASACQPVPHPVVEVRSPANGNVTFFGQSDDGRYAVVRAAAADDTFPGPGTYRVDRTDRSVLALPDLVQLYEISADGRRVYYRTAANTRPLWVEGSAVNRPDYSTMASDLRFAFVTGSGDTPTRWTTATGARLNLDTVAPRPAATPQLSVEGPRGVSADGNVVWYGLKGPSACILRFVFLDEGLVRDAPCGTTSVVSANGSHRIVYGFGNDPVTASSLIVHIDNRTGQVIRSLRPPTGVNGGFQSPRLSDDGKTVWAVEISWAGNFDCIPMQPWLCTGTYQADRVIAASPGAIRRFGVDPTLHDGVTGDVGAAFAISPGSGRFAVFGSDDQLSADLWVVDRLVAPEDAEEIIDLGQTLSPAGPQISGDGRVVSHAVRTAPSPPTTGWYEHLAS